MSSQWERGRGGKKLPILRIKKTTKRAEGSKIADFVRTLFMDGP